MERINRQAELNSIDVGERHADSEHDKRRMYRACEIVEEKTGAPASRLYELMKREPENDVEREWVDAIREQYETLGDEFKHTLNKHHSMETSQSSAAIRLHVGKEFGVDVDKAIAKEKNRRSGQWSRNMPGGCLPT